MNYFSDFRVSKPEFNLLPVGEHIVRLHRYEESDSFHQFNGERKQKVFGWEDPTPVLLVTVVAENGSGSLTHPLNGLGYVKYSELSDKQKASGEYQDVGGYACVLQDGHVVRVVSEEATKRAMNILNEFANSIGATEGDSLSDVLERAVYERIPFKVTVVNDEYDGREQLRLTRFKKITSVISELE